MIIRYITFIDKNISILQILMYNVYVAVLLELFLTNRIAFIVTMIAEEKMISSNFPVFRIVWRVVF